MGSNLVARLGVVEPLLLGGEPNVLGIAETAGDGRICDLAELLEAKRCGRIDAVDLGLLLGRREVGCALLLRDLARVDRSGRVTRQGLAD